MPRVSKTGLGLTLLWATLYLLDGAQARSIQRLPGRPGHGAVKDGRSAQGGDSKPKGNLLFQTEFWCIPFNLRWTCYTGVIECNCGSVSVGSSSFATAFHTPSTDQLKSVELLKSKSS
ncbi:uncharacterized protein LOC119432556 [Dermacentor silvarum]|uniref:uncharacterized protein LOC119432556 n=1 Tax=Dermacentor silvarum TaxID=543639 RepID=UPI00189B13FC|nr:uncharacterized protein LOC119432556 [Dermacentor silvarum]